MQKKFPNLSAWTEQEKTLVAAEVAKLPAEFYLKGWPGKKFRVDPNRSYYSGVYQNVQIVVQVKVKDDWLDFAVNSSREISEFVRLEPTNF